MSYFHKGIEFPSKETAMAWEAGCQETELGIRLFHEQLKSGEITWAEVCYAHRKAIQKNSENALRE